MSTTITIPPIPQPADAMADNLLATAQALTLAAVKQQVSDWNNSLKATYLTKFANWAQQITSGKSSDTSTPPQPPRAYVVGYFTDPTSGPGSVGPYGDMPVQWAYPQAGLAPVCAMPPIPGVIIHVNGTMLVGTQNPDAPEWFNAQQDDRTPVGTVAPGVSKDGIVGLYQKFGGVVGAGYFKRIG